MALLTHRITSQMLHIKEIKPFMYKILQDIKVANSNEMLILSNVKPKKEKLKDKYSPKRKKSLKYPTQFVIFSSP